ncbi:MAG TPA: Ppx/GppA phosphatase family protein [Acidimicrobiia bacterium]|jgi:exopolyphosphatase/guanosine-5'-triphosphate,3'-diphosphate pyrophosphatase|nr:Ppx/GppA phosphatase family protein [Acidimicrobiia bacterium]
MRIAAIDLGTNSFHLLVVDAGPDGSFVPLVREKEMLRLGDDVARDGRISRDAARRALATLRRFRALAEGAGATRVVACATSAFREASNGRRLAAMLAEQTGIEARIIDGETEAGLIYSAVRASVLMEKGPVLAFDLGGGSLEVMVGDGEALWWANSLPLGVARLTAEVVRHDPLTGGDQRRLRKRIIDLLEPVAGQIADLFDVGAPGGPALAVGSGGTFCDLARMVAYRRSGGIPVSVNQFTFSRLEFLDLHEELMAATAAERRRMPGLELRRVDLVPAGAMLLATAMELFGFDELTVSEWALREGMVLDSLRALRPVDAVPLGVADIRRASVQALARRCNWDEAHARHVARLALQIFDHSHRLHRLHDDDRELLEYAALLHDIGEHVSVLAQHKHTSYLIQHGRLRGFAPDEVLALAAVARYGGRGYPKSSHKPFGSLSPKRRDRVVKLAVMLRLADALDRGRAQVVDSVGVELSGGRLRLQLRSTRNCELELWATTRQGALLERVFGRRLDLLADGKARTPQTALPFGSVAASAR